MKFSKEKFLKNASELEKKLYGHHADIVDGFEVNHDSMIKYELNGKKNMFYPIKEEWCEV